MVAPKSQMKQTTLSDKIRVFPPKDGCWKVEFFIPFEEMSDECLSEILREAKKIISHRDRIPVGMLSYKDLIQKEIKVDGYQITAQILRDEAERGEPVLRFLNSTNAGIEYDEMILYADIYPKKPSGDLVDISDLEALLQKAKVSKDKIDLKNLQNALHTALTDMTPMKNVLLAQGRFPDHSEDAKVEFLFPFRNYSDNTFIGTEKVEVDKILCHKSPMVKGAIAGHTVRNVPIQPVEPKDIEIITGFGCKLTSLGNEIVTTERGIPRVLESKSKEKPFSKRLTFSIEAVEIQDGSQIINITSEKHIKVKGDLKSGSNIISQGEVFIEGNVEEGTSVIASGGINIGGIIHGGTLISENDISSESDVYSAKLIAQGRLTIKGTAMNSELVGYEVRSEKVIGCKITAGLGATLDTASADEKGFSTMITIGMVEHLKERYQENEQFINFARKNLNHLREVIGDEIVDTTTSANISRMVIIYCKDLKQKGISRVTKDQLDAMKGLFATIGPMRELLQEKVKTNYALMSQIKKGEMASAEVTVTQGVKSLVEVNINGIKGEIKPEDLAVVVKNEGGLLTKRPFVIDSIDNAHNTAVGGN
jgi:uncharacterized protein (DUF342 family)